MIELRWVERPRPIRREWSREAGEYTVCEVVRVLQYREVLSTEVRLGVQSAAEAEIVRSAGQWRDVPIERAE